MRGSRKLFLLAILYLIYACYELVKVFRIPACKTEADNKSKKRCFKPALQINEPVELQLCYESNCFLKLNGTSLSDLNYEGELKIPISKLVRKNGTAEIEARLKGASFTTRAKVKMTRHKILKAAPGKVLWNGAEAGPDDNYLHDAYEKKKPVTFWRKSVPIRILDEMREIPEDGIPETVKLQFNRKNAYFPPILVDDDFLLPWDWNLLSRNVSKGSPVTKLEIKVQTLPSFFFHNLLAVSFRKFEEMGLQEEDFAEVKKIFTQHGLFRILMEYLFGFLHVYLGTMAFKNDIGFWKKTNSSRGLSASGVITRWLMQGIILLNLYNYPNISSIVLIMNFTSLAIEAWKVTKILKATVVWGRAQGGGFFPITFQRQEQNEQELETDRYDSECFKVLSVILFPILIAFGIYDLRISLHASWWSWFITNAAYGVYMAGFIFMIPQLYINYKLKSVAHMPWRSMVYKTFNTFVDDIFAFFIVDTPISYRLATFRDDIVFIAFLYQMWAYRTDYTRANEFGFSYARPTPSDEAEKEKEPKKEPGTPLACKDEDDEDERGDDDGKVEKMEEKKEVEEGSETEGLKQRMRKPRT